MDYFIILNYFELFWFELLATIALVFLFGLLLVQQIAYSIKRLDLGIASHKITPNLILVNGMWLALFLTTKSYILFGICFTLLIFMLYNAVCSKRIAG